MQTPLQSIEYPPPGTAYTPASDADAVHEALAAARAVKRWAGWIALLAAGLTLLGFTSGSPNARIGKLETRVDSLETRSSATLREVQDVKFILCAQVQPTGVLAAERCVTRRAP